MSDTETYDDTVIEAVRSALDEVMGISLDMDTLDTPLADAGIDSLDLIETVMVVEEGLGISTSESDFEGVSTLREAIEVFERHKASA